MVGLLATVLRLRGESTGARAQSAMRSSSRPVADEARCVFTLSQGSCDEDLSASSCPACWLVQPSAFGKAPPQRSRLQASSMLLGIVMQLHNNKLRGWKVQPVERPDAIDCRCAKHLISKYLRNNMPGSPRLSQSARRQLLPFLCASRFSRSGLTRGQRASSSVVQDEKYVVGENNFF